MNRRNFLKTATAAAAGSVAPAGAPRDFRTACGDRRGRASLASVVITGIDSPAILDQAFKAVKTFSPMEQQQVAAILAKTTEAAMTGKFELFKTSSRCDGTIKNPSWPGYTGG